MAHIDDERAQVDAARAHEGAFSAEHALLQFDVELVVLTAAEGVMHLADVEIRELPGGAGSRAAAAPDAQSVAGDLAEQLVHLAHIGLTQVEGARLLDGKTKIYHITIYVKIQAAKIRFFRISPSHRHNIPWVNT